MSSRSKRVLKTPARQRNFVNNNESPSENMLAKPAGSSKGRKIRLTEDLMSLSLSEKVCSPPKISDRNMREQVHEVNSIVEEGNEKASHTKVAKNKAPEEMFTVEKMNENTAHSLLIEEITQRRKPAGRSSRRKIRPTEDLMCLSLCEKVYSPPKTSNRNMKEQVHEVNSILEEGNEKASHSKVAKNKAPEEMFTVEKTNENTAQSLVTEEITQRRKFVKAKRALKKPQTSENTAESVTVDEKLKKKRKKSHTPSVDEDFKERNDLGSKEIISVHKKSVKKQEKSQTPPKINEDFEESNMVENKENIDLANNFIYELNPSLKKKRSTLGKQHKIEEDSFAAVEEISTIKDEDKQHSQDDQNSFIGDEEISIIRNEDTKQLPIATDCEENSVIIIEEASSGQSNDLIVTTLRSPISPSTTNENPSPVNVKSPIEEILHFDKSIEDVHPSTSGQPTRRRTFELENSVHDISLLKSISNGDSVRMSSFPSEEESPGKPKSKVTIRRKWEKSNRTSWKRLSKVSPPWYEFNNSDGEHTPQNNRKSPNEKTLPQNDSKLQYHDLQSEAEVTSSQEVTNHSLSNETEAAQATPLQKRSNHTLQNTTDVAEDTPPRNRRRSQSHGLLKSVLSREMSVESTPPQKKRRSQSHSQLKNLPAKEVKPSTTKKASSVKIPNFAAIHQRAFDRMENLSEYKKRKEDRAKMLLSGQKPLVAKKTPKKELKKMLRFAANTSEKEKPFNFIPLPSTPRPSKVPNVSLDNLDTPESVEKVSFKFTFNQESLVNRKLTPKIAEKIESSVQKKVLTPKNINVKPKLFDFANKKPQFNFAQIDNNFNKFQFNTGKQVAANKKEEFKEMILKKVKPVKSTVDSRRVYVKGVRSNRRFDLLMEMRKGK